MIVCILRHTDGEASDVFFVDTNILRTLTHTNEEEITYSGGKVADILENSSDNSDEDDFNFDIWSTDDFSKSYMELPANVDKTFEWWCD